MGQKTRAKVLECQYYQEKNLIVWALQPVGEEKTVRMGFRATDLGHCLGVNVEIPPSAIEQFCKLITGKEINWVMEVDQQSLPSFRDETNETTDQIWEMSQKLNDYPIIEIAELEQK